MSSPLAQCQADLAAYALHEDGAAHERLLAASASTPVPSAMALQVHVSCVHAALRAALAQRVPTVVALVGEEFFTWLARDFSRNHPPTAPQLSCWGENLPDFLRSHPQCQSLPWLGDVAAFDLAIDRVAWTDPATDLQQGVRLLPLQYAVDELRDAVAAALAGDDTALANVDLTPAPRTFRLWCAEDATVRCRRVTAVVESAGSEPAPGTPAPN